MFHVPNEYRVRSGPLGSPDNYGNNGAFLLNSPTRGATLRTIASDGDGWEHVSVSYHDQCPSWEDMCFVKDLFWDEEDNVVQFHPPKSQYVNHHPYTLHLWRNKVQAVMLPPGWMIGPKG